MKDLFRERNPVRDECNAAGGSAPARSAVYEECDPVGGDPATPCADRGISGLPGSAAQARAGPKGNPRPVFSPGAERGGDGPGGGCHHRDAHGLRQNHVLQPARAFRDSAEPGCEGAVYFSDQGAELRSGERAVRADRGDGRGYQNLHL